MLKKLALSLMIGLSSYSITSQAAPIVTDSVALMRSVLQQERQWAGLESKTIKVGETTFAYSEVVLKAHLLCYWCMVFRARVIIGIELRIN